MSLHPLRVRNGRSFAFRTLATMVLSAMIVGLSTTPAHAAPTISAKDASVTEGNSGTRTVNVPVELSATSSQTVTVDFETKDGTARGGSSVTCSFDSACDYVTTSGTLVFEPGDTSEEVSVQIKGDTAVEPDETFTVELSNAEGATIADGVALVTILNDDLPPPTLPQISIDDPEVVEGTGAGSTTLTFTASLSKASEQAVTVRFATADGTATAPADYVPAQGTLSIPAGSTQAPINVTVNRDSFPEPAETLKVRLSQPTNATISDEEGVGKILNDDGPPPRLRIDDTQVTETESTQNATFRVALSSTVLQEVRVDFATAPGTATAGTDYTTTAGTLRLLPGQTSGTINVPVRGDSKAEADETFIVKLSNPSNAVIEDDTAVGTIVDDDSLGTFYPVNPKRVLDTRSGIGAPKAKRSAGSTLVLDVTGRDNVPSTGVQAVVLNVVATQPATGGYVSVTPTGGNATSNLNFGAGQTISNLVLVPVGSDGNVRIFTSASTHLVADIFGWYSDGTTSKPGSHFMAATPSRLLDTRIGQGAPQAKRPAGSTLELKIEDRPGSPTGGVAAVALRVTVTQPDKGGHVSVTPAGGSATSNLNFSAGETTGNLVMVPVHTDGKVRIFTSQTTHLVADVFGYFAKPGTTTATTLRTIAPDRLLDTRIGKGAPKAPRPSGSTLNLDVTGVGRLPATGVKAVVLNVVAVKPASAGFLSVTPEGGATTSSVNYRAGQIISGLVAVQVAEDGFVRIYTSATTHMVADAFAYFTD